MRLRFWLACTLWLVCWSIVPLHAQTSPNSSAPPNPAGGALPGAAGQPAGFGDGRQGGNGGMSRQDWSTLLMLISQTIDPDEWRDFGGTGNSTMLPYPNGIWLDAQGHLKRIERHTNATQGGASASAHQSWLHESGLRTLSLKRLNQAIANCRQSGIEPTAQMHHMAGLTHIEYVAIDVDNCDVLLAGPVATGDSQLQAMNLEDLCMLANLMTDHSAPLGCSLDPQGQGLIAAQQLLRMPSTVTRLGRSPQTVADQLKGKVGPHEVHIFGIDAKSSTALALVDADEMMKRVGLGLEKTQPHIKSYFEHLDRKGSVKAQSLIRWWFSFNDQPLTVNPEGNLYQMPKQAAATMSEEQWMAANGQRQATGGVDQAADAFAKELTEKFTELQATIPAFARLEGIFEISLALQVAIESSHQPSWKAWFPEMVHEARYITLHNQAPSTVEGVTAWDRLHNGTVVAVISGGVMLDTSSLIAQSRTQNKSCISRPAKLDSSKQKADAWWWD